MQRTINNEKIEENIPSHHKQLAKLNRISGQIEAIKRMIDDERYCVDIMMQMRAARNALKSVELAVLETHMHNCIQAACQEDETALTPKIQELLTLLKKYE